MWLFWLLLLVVVVAAVVYLVRRKASVPRVMPYGNLRSGIISAWGDSSARRPDPPARPAGLDVRLPAAHAEALRAVSDISEDHFDENWTQAHELYCGVVDSIRKELSAIDRDEDWYELLSPERRTIILIDNLEAEVNNGGFDQFFLNSSGDGAHLTPEACDALGVADVGELVRRANAQFPDGPSPSRKARLAQMDALPQSARETWSKLDDLFFDLKLPPGGLAAGHGIPFILQHEREFFRE